MASRVDGLGEQAAGPAVSATPRALSPITQGLSADAALLLLGGMFWWACHYTLLWDSTVARAYSLAAGYDLRFLATLAGTVGTLLVVALLARRNAALRLADSAISFAAYALSSALALVLIALPVVGVASPGVGLAGAVVSGVGNSVALVFYGELHARIARRLEPLAFALEMAAGLVLSVVFSQLPLVGEMACAALSAVAAAVLLFRFGRRCPEACGEAAAAASPVRVDISLRQLLVLAALTGLTYGLMRTFTTGSISADEPLLGLGSERLGSLLCAVLLVVAFCWQRRASLFDQCLLFAVPFVATGMLLVSLEGTSAAVAATVNTCGFACFFALSWYFAAIMADESRRHGSPLSVTACVASLLLASQLFQLAGALVPERFANVFSSVLMYLIFAATLFMFWRDKERAAASCGSGSPAVGSASCGAAEGAVCPSPGDAAAREAGWAGEYGFSAREAQIVSLLMRRTPYRQIAEDLGVSENTVKTHVRNIYKKADVASREELLAKLGGPAVPAASFPSSPENRE